MIGRVPFATVILGIAPIAIVRMRSVAIIARRWPTASATAPPKKPNRASGRDEMTTATAVESAECVTCQVTYASATTVIRSPNPLTTCADQSSAKLGDRSASSAAARIIDAASS